MWCGREGWIIGGKGGGKERETTYNNVYPPQSYVPHLNLSTRPPDKFLYRKIPEFAFFRSMVTCIGLFPTSIFAFALPSASQTIPGPSSSSSSNPPSPFPSVKHTSPTIHPVRILTALKTLCMTTLHSFPSFHRLLRRAVRKLLRCRCF